MSKLDLEVQKEIIALDQFWKEKNPKVSTQHISPIEITHFTRTRFRGLKKRYQLGLLQKIREHAEAFIKEHPEFISNPEVNDNTVSQEVASGGGETPVVSNETQRGKKRKKILEYEVMEAGTFSYSTH